MRSLFCIRRWRWFLPPLIVAIALAVMTPAAYAYVLWSGVDPVFTVNGHQFNVWIEWPSEYTCAIEEPIAVSVQVPQDAAVTFVSESAGDFGCGWDIQTETELTTWGPELVRVSAVVESEEAFTVHALVYLDGELVATGSGSSNGKVQVQPVSLP